jgi:hypothetical protein
MEAVAGDKVFRCLQRFRGVTDVFAKRPGNYSAALRSGRQMGRDPLKDQGVEVLDKPLKFLALFHLHRFS